LAIGFDEVWEDNVKVLRADCLPLLVGRVLSPEGSGQQNCQRHEMFHEAYEVRRKYSNLVALYCRLRKSDGSCKVCIFKSFGIARGTWSGGPENRPLQSLPMRARDAFREGEAKPNSKVRERALSAR
jgi:hypothetical protein